MQLIKRRVAAWPQNDCRLDVGNIIQKCGVWSFVALFPKGLQSGLPPAPINF
jgi:hypothetical protein